MGANRRAATIELTDEERKVLEGYARRRTTAQALALRARIVLRCAEGGESTAIAAEMKLDRNTVARWRTRFAKLRLQGLHDEPRPGAPRKIADAKVESVIVDTLESKPKGATHWSTRDMAKHSGLSHSTVGRRRHRSTEFVKFLQQLDDSVPQHLDVHVILDNLQTHKTPAAHRWFLRHPRFHVHFTPTYSSWLNQVERWFALLEQKALKRGVHRSTVELERAIYEFIEVSNEEPRPYLWTKSADDILDNLSRFCGRTLNSQGALANF
jgi:transposase